VEAAEPALERLAAEVMAIRFYSEQIQFACPYKRHAAAWLSGVIVRGYGRMVGEVSVVFCSDAYLLQMNRDYLGHDYFTDVIAFDYSRDGRVSGDIFVSVDSVGCNAVEYGVSFDDELRRVMLHGVLHLCGEDDGTADEQAAMFQAQERWLREWDTHE
jgi:rRNA maturation RNase YbeY